MKPHEERAAEAGVQLDDGKDPEAYIWPSPLDCSVERLEKLRSLPAGSIEGAAFDKAFHYLSIDDPQVHVAGEIVDGIVGPVDGSS